GGTADRNRSHWSTSKTPSYTKSVSWQHHPFAIDNTHSVALQQDFFDKVFPNILPMAYTLLMYYFLRVKKAHPVLLIGVTFVLSIVCSAFGIL
ncbi:PTS system mannose/fructose/sorbose family transporter subunit IID, partial [Escherichia coli]|nr:PTS system mannose/fructose/sorbose family transporter subunit IID [Escherichia coli]